MPTPPAAAGVVGGGGVGGAAGTAGGRRPSARLHEYAAMGRVQEVRTTVRARVLCAGVGPAAAV